MAPLTATASNPLAPPRTISRLRVIDFDSTLFRSPLPNRDLWSDHLRGALISDCGWFQEPRTLAPPYVPEAPGPAWWHTETLGAIAAAATARADTLVVLLTGRRHDRFGARIRQMCESRALPFDMHFFREGTDPNAPRSYATTLDFKLAVLQRLLDTFPGITDVQLWDDRPRHLELFGNAFRAMREQGRLSTFVMHHVSHLERDAMSMPEELEAGLVAELVAACNARIVAARERDAARQQAEAAGVAVTGETGAGAESLAVGDAAPAAPISPSTLRRGMKRRTSASVFRDLLTFAPEVRYTGVMLDPASREALVAAFPLPDPDWNPRCHHLTVCMGPAKPHLVDPLGGLGARVEFDAVAHGCLEGAVTAVLVAPPPPPAELAGGDSPPPAPALSENASPHVTLAVAPGAKAAQSNAISTWTPLPAPLRLCGRLAEHRVTGLKPAHPHPPQRKRDVSIGELVMKHHPGIGGPAVGRAVQRVEAWMAKTFMENLGQNRANIEHFVQGMDVSAG